MAKYFCLKSRVWNPERREAVNVMIVTPNKIKAQKEGTAGTGLNRLEQTSRD